MSKLLSVIIPTRNRQKYCLESIKSILNDLDDRCELVIQDNSSDDSLQAMILSLNSPLIVYNYNGKALSFVDNFEEAVMLSTGKYFIVLGDDDSTTKDTIPLVEWMDRENVESISSNFVVDYIWPNDTIVEYKTGHLSIPDYNGKIQDTDVDKNLKDLIKNGFLAYQTYNLPRTYHGIVKRSCMDEVKKVSGRYFGGLTPDIYSTIALACVIKSHKIIDYPFSIAGACPASATVNSTVGGHSGELKDAPHFNHRGAYEWEKVIPYYYSVETIWAETAIKALKDMKYPHWEKDFNKYKLYVYGIYINKKYILKLSVDETLKLSSTLGISKLNHVAKFSTMFLQSVFNKFFGKNKLAAVSNPTIIENVKDLQACKEEVYKCVKQISF